ncbi:uncharacterized protein SAMN05878503_10688 [Cereibacter ovatus]|uniref:DUF1499 domain-containing protein n=1 Tax=Cereibacter ovatus TaxID=439529 RepID=A0A285CSL2_9RHOB|nr:DUF1499 domain-containing protein [Cereibacter ovatus]SNX70522.1 uncharacterized protein SAMN05878503_10688 [Cereibacter ovatus]
MTTLLLALVLLTGAAAAYVRLAPNDPARWHADPATVAGRNTANSILVADGGDLPPLHLPLPADQVAARLDTVAAATSRTSPFAGEGLHRTWLTRTRLWGFPDFTSVRLIPAPDGGTFVTIFARARFGHSDLGVNRARVEDWLARLQSPSL